MITQRTKPLHAYLVIAFLAIMAMPQIGHCSISDATILFLNLNDSPRGIGIGGCSINLVTSESPLYNPAGLGLFHLDHRFSLNVPNSTKWFPSLSDQLRLQSWGVSGGVRYRFVHPEGSLPLNVAVGVAYSRLKMDYGTYPLTDPLGRTIGSVHPYDKADCLSAGVGLEYSAFRFGAGFTYKRLNSVLANLGVGTESKETPTTGNAHDFGFLAQIRLHDLLSYKLYLSQSRKYYMHAELTPSYGYVKANVGDPMAYIDFFEADKLPEASRRGPGVYGAIDINQARLVSVYWTEETWKSDYSDDRLKTHGLEIGVGDIVFFRSGKYAQPGLSPIDTRGIGLSLSGLIHWLDLVEGIDSAHNPVGRWASRVDLRFDYAKLDDPTSVLNGTEFYKLTFSLRQ